MSNPKKRKLTEPAFHNPLIVTCTHRNYDRLNKQKHVRTVTSQAPLNIFVVPRPPSHSFSFDGSGSTSYHYEDYVPANPVTAASLGIKEKEATKRKRYENSVCVCIVSRFRSMLLTSWLGFPSTYVYGLPQPTTG